MNKLKRVLSGTLALALAASMMTACGNDDSSAGGSNSGTQGGGKDESGKTVVKVYTFTDETQGMLDGFLEDNPEFAEKYTFDITLEATASTYQQKTMSALASDDAPDLFLADADYAKKFAALEQTASLADLGITIKDEEYYSYVLDFTTIKGQRMALSHQAAPGVVLYRRDYAEEVLGSGDPAEVQKHMDTWDHFVETAEAMKEKGYYMIAGIDELKRCFMNNRSSAWVNEDTMEYQLDKDTVSQFLEVTKKLADEKCTSDVTPVQWNANWYKGMKDGVFCFFGCSWYLHYTIKPNCLAEVSTGKVDAKTGSQEADEKDYKEGNGSFGKWGIIAGPAPYFWGGTWWYGSKKCLEDGTKDAVKQVIEYFCVNDDSLLKVMQKKGDFTSKPAVNDKLTADPESSTYKFLAGQDWYTIFREAAPNIDTKTTCLYDDEFNTAVDNALKNYITNGMSLDDAIAGIATEVKSSLKDVKFPE